MAAENGNKFSSIHTQTVVHFHWSEIHHNIDGKTALHDNLQFIFLLRLNVCNDLAKAMKALDGKNVLNSPQTFQKTSQTSHKFQNILLLHDVVVNDMQLLEKMQTQFGRKLVSVGCWKKRVKPIVKNIMHIQETKLHHKRPNSLANAKHAANVFRNNHWSSCPGTLSCKVQKTSKNISIPHVIPPFCSKSRAVCQEDIVVTKFQLQHQVMQKRSTCVSTEV